MTKGFPTENEIFIIKPKIDFMPYWAKQDQCFLDEQIEYKDRAGFHI